MKKPLWFYPVTVFIKLNDKTLYSLLCETYIKTPEAVFFQNKLGTDCAPFNLTVSQRHKAVFLCRYLY